MSERAARTTGVVVLVVALGLLAAEGAGAGVIVDALMRDPHLDAAGVDRSEISLAQLAQDRVLGDAVSSALEPVPWNRVAPIPDPVAEEAAAAVPSAGQGAGTTCLDLKWQDYRHAGVAQLCNHQ